ncbi:NADH-quinone oxidoreductase subunit A [Actinomyces sp. W5033]|uniref:NADH-quinone oxidoreductase subunit A n=1 Tax=Actinomyces sp. W5033 TaxID=3446479 RepID=UPI003EE356D7
MNPYVSLLIMAAVAVVVAVGGLALSAVVSPNRRNRVKTANYECGIDPTPANTEHGRFPVGFYLVGMTFIIFDVEVVFLYPWATAFAGLRVFGMLAALLFIALITVPYVLEWRRGGLDWD